MQVSFENVARSRSRRRPRDGLAFIASHNDRGSGRHMTITITSRPESRLKTHYEGKGNMVPSIQAWRRKQQLIRPFDYGNL